MSRLIKDKSAMFYIIIMIIVWVCTSLTFYMFNFFIKYMPGDIYFNSIVSSFAVGALIFQAWLVKTIGAKRSMMLTFAVTTLSSLLLCFYDKGTPHLLAYALTLMVAKGGATMNFGLAYAIHQDLFPQFFMITSYGLCNFFCRGLAMFAPIIAEVPNRLLPLAFCVLMSTIGFFASSSLRKKEEETPDDQDPSFSIITPRTFKK